MILIDCINLDYCWYYLDNWLFSLVLILKVLLVISKSGCGIYVPPHVFISRSMTYYQEYESVRFQNRNDNV
jgi:hypothetical protein